MKIDPERILQIQDSKLVQCFLCKVMSRTAEKLSDVNPLWWIAGLATCSVVLSGIIDSDFDVTGEASKENLAQFANHVKEAVERAKASRLNDDEVKYVGALSERIVNKAKACLIEKGERS